MIESMMSLQELLALPVSVDLVTAGRAFGIGRSQSYELVKSDQFPCRVIPVGRRKDGSPSKFRVPRAALLEALGVEDGPAVTGTAA